MWSHLNKCDVSLIASLHAILGAIGNIVASLLALEGCNVRPKDPPIFTAF